MSDPLSGRVRGKVALVTGAGGGIGRATCLAMAREGARVCATDIDLARAQESAELARAIGADAIACAHDVASEDDWRGVLSETIARFGKLDILVNNAGVAGGAPLLEFSLEEWRRQLSINLDGVFLGLREAIRAMQTGRDDTLASIINISSIFGLVGSPNVSAYSAGKGAVRLLSKSVALEAAARGWRVRVNSVHPGYIVTPMVLNSIAARPTEEAREKMQADILAAHPLGRLGAPEDIAAGILYLASDESAFVTGAELVIDGGYTAR